MLTKSNITGLILAGGAGKRVGYQDKGLIVFEGEPLIQRQIEWLRPQVDDIIISANRNIDTYRKFGYRVLNDQVDNSVESEKTSEVLEFNGPLSGLHQGLVNSNTSHVYVHPVDLPFLPNDTVRQILDYANRPMSDKVNQKKINSSFYLKTDEREHYLSLLIECRLLDELKTTLDKNNHRVSQFLQESNIQGTNLNIPESKFANLNFTEDFFSY